ncbi:hypothetical protein [Shinella sp. G-2]|uniref:hypothetical protein n=1 Tax=Shinella sp. G-2 TaxID=3133141 RepID=UPI003D066D71
MIGRMTLAAALIAFAATPTLAGSLDPLLKGFDDGCDYTEALGGLLQSSYAFARKEGKVELPSGYKALFGEVTVTPIEDYLEITIPVKNSTWRGVPVRQINAYITPLESGLSSHVIVFPKDAEKAAEAAFRERGIASQKKVKAKDDGGFGWGTGYSIDKDGAPSYMCDLST